MTQQQQDNLERVVKNLMWPILLVMMGYFGNRLVEDLDALSDDLDEIKTEQRVIKNEITHIKSDIQEVKNDTAKLRDEVDAIKKNLISD